MLDLERLGQELRARRRALRIPSAELARRIGVSPTYVWLVERAKPRSSGEPSRLGLELLDRWTVALGIAEEEVIRLRELAGYFGPDPVVRGDAGGSLSEPISRRSRSRTGSTPDLFSDARGQSAEQARENEAQEPLDLRRWAARARRDESEGAMAEQLQDVLHRAESVGRKGEVSHLLRSYLEWLDFYLEMDR